MKTLINQNFDTFDDMLRSIKEFNKCEVIIETGISWGRFTFMFLETFPQSKYYGYDNWGGLRLYDEEMMKKTFGDNPNVILTKIRTPDLKEFPNADLIHINSCFIPQELELALRCLKPNGIIIVNCMWMEPIIKIIDDWYNQNQKDYHMHIFRIQVWDNYKMAMIWRKK